MSGHVIGYARVSTREQSTDRQEQALRDAGAERIFVDQGQSSRRRDRPQWIACQEYLRRGDTLLVWKLDRLAGTTQLALETINSLHDRGINIKSLSEPDIDTTTAMGRALFGFVAVLMQLRVDTIRENTLAGLAAAKAAGRVGGRPTVMTPDRLEAAHALRAQGMSYNQIARSLGVGRSSVTRAFARQGDSREAAA